MPLTTKDMERWRPVWESLSDLFLDTELEETHLRSIAQTLVESEYTDEELARILYDEVFPVCIWNMRSVAGEWAGIDVDWLQERILANERKFWKKWCLFQTDRWMIRDDWHRVMVLVREARSGAASNVE